MTMKKFCANLLDLQALKNQMKVRWSFGLPFLLILLPIASSLLDDAIITKDDEDIRETLKNKTNRLEEIVKRLMLPDSLPSLFTPSQCFFVDTEKTVRLDLTYRDHPDNLNTAQELAWGYGWPEKKTVTIGSFSPIQNTELPCSYLSEKFTAFPTFSAASAFAAEAGKRFAEDSSVQEKIAPLLHSDRMGEISFKYRILR